MPAQQHEIIDQAAVTARLVALVEKLESLKRGEMPHDPVRELLVGLAEVKVEIAGQDKLLLKFDHALYDSANGIIIKLDRLEQKQEQNEENATKRDGHVNAFGPILLMGLGSLISGGIGGAVMKLLTLHL